jgi:hypothetical protein
MTLIPRKAVHGEPRVTMLTERSIGRNAGF